MTFEVNEDIAQLSNLLNDLMPECDEEDDSETIKIPLRIVKGPVLAKVIEFCTYYIDDPSE